MKRIRKNLIKKPQKVKRLKTEEIILVFIVISLLFTFIFLSSAFEVYIPNLSHLLLFLGVLSTLNALMLLIFWYRREKRKIENSGLSSIFSDERFQCFCFEEGLYTQSLYDLRYINIPEVRITKDGFKMTALPGIAEKCLNAKEDLSNFLSQNGLDIYIVNAYAGGDGWLYYTVSKDFRKDIIDEK